jgi:YggT family protein
MNLIHEIISLYILILFIAAALSWFPVSSNNGSLAQIKRIFSSLTEPVLRPLRQILPRPRAGGVPIDFSVMVAIILLYLINRII